MNSVSVSPRSPIKSPLKSPLKSPRNAPLVPKPIFTKGSFSQLMRDSSSREQTKKITLAKQPSIPQNHSTQSTKSDISSISNLTNSTQSSQTTPTKRKTIRKSLLQPYDEDDTNRNRKSIFELEEELIQRMKILKKFEFESETTGKVYAKTKEQMTLKEKENTKAAKEILKSIEETRKRLEGLQRLQEQEEV